MKKILSIFLSSIILTYSVSCQSVDGIDVARYQKNINWEKVSKNIGKDAFVYVKCTEGASHSDPKYKTNAKGAKKAGLHVGGYHFFRMTSSSQDQFNSFKKALDNIDPDLIPMVDVETGDGYSTNQIQDSLQVFLDLLEKEYGKKPMIYGTQRSYNTFCAPRFNSYPLYIGRYGKNVPVVKGPSHYTIWQYSEKGKVHGIKTTVDLCKFHPQKGIKDISL